MTAAVNRLRTINRGAAGLLGGLALVAYALAAGLASVARGLDPGLALTLAVLGLGLGWWLGMTRATGLVSGPCLAGAGLLAVVVRVSGTTLPIVRLAGDLLSQSLRRWPDPTVLQDPTGFVLASQRTGEAMLVVAGRLGHWLGGLATGQPAFDPAATAVVWGYVIWLAVAWSGWWGSRRRRALVGVLPGLVVLMSAEAYSNGPWWPAAVGLVGWLISLAFGAQAPVEDRARAGYVDLPEGLAGKLGRVVLPLALGLAGLGALAPEVSVEQWVHEYQAWRLASSGNPALARSLGVESVSEPARASADLTRPGLPNRHLIGSGPELSQQPVMRVTVQLPSGVSDPASYYWKSVTYDVYTGHGWATSPTQAERVSTGQKLFRSLPGQTQTLHQAFQLMQPADGQIYAAGSLMRLDRPSTAAWRTPGEDLFGVSAAGVNYQLDSAWPVYSPEDLRGDEQTLPDDVRGRYLQLPDGIPTEVLALARDLTASQATEYDQAKAVEAYLRTLPYSLDVPQPPVSGDIVDVFLFQLKTGYCDYYASAMVVLARAVGIPARIAVGYATGEATQVGPGRISYLITAAEAHTWVEVYFAGVGWVPFEPTAGRPPLDQVEAVLPAGAEATGPRAGSSAGSAGSILLVWGFVSALGVIVAGVVWQAVDQLRLSRLSSDGLPKVLLARHQALSQRWLRLPASNADTPNEYERRFQSHLGGAAAPPGSMVWRLQADLHALVSALNTTSYSQQALPSDRLDGLRRRWPVMAIELVMWGLVHSIRSRRGVDHKPDDAERARMPQA